MRTQTMMTISRRRRRARRRHALALALGVCALAVPAAGASADPSGADGSSLNTIDPTASEPRSSSGSVDCPYGGGADCATPDATLGSDGRYGSGADYEPTGVVSGSPADTGDGFDWVSALVGAGAALALAALGSAALLTFRRRTAVSPSPSAS